MKTYTQAEALNKAAAYCTLCERCVSEVITKLTAWGVSASEQQSIITRLIEEKFIDEARYCRAFVNDKLRFNHWGRIKIVAALRDKHLPKEYINEAIESIDEENYIKILKEIVAIKHKELKGQEDYTTKQKLIRHAASRGFEPAMIMRIINIGDYEMDF